MGTIPPWAQGPFELIVHAEEHLQKGEDFDRRIALISFDNSVEVAISTYLSLHPIQRGGKEYPKENIDKWLKDFHTKLDFLEAELLNRHLKWEIEKAHIIWAHGHRNEQYHGGKKGIPEKQVLMIIRSTALWVLTFLFNLTDTEKILENVITGKFPPPPPERDPQLDRAIDAEHGMVELAGQPYHTSEVLFAIDKTAYREIGTSLLFDETGLNEDKK
jgi:hypothetical protein